MESAINKAKECKNDIPVGCVIKKDGEIISAAYNQRELYNDVTAHAEILAIKEAQMKMQTSRLNDCEMFVTLEPCPMCAWAIIQSGIKNLYFGAYNTQYGAMGSVIDLVKIAKSKLKVYGGIKEEECSIILDNFFQKMRIKNKGN